MKWFFALNEEGNEFENYAKMLKVAVYTAKKFTSLEPYLIYDGRENFLTEWLIKRNVRIIKRRSFLYKKLEEISEKRNDRGFLKIAAGAFLRTEIPEITLEIGINDNFVLYTDVDVMFMSEVTDSLKNLNPKYFAVAPEFEVKDYKKMNTGVMVMNLENLRKESVKFKEFITRKLDSIIDLNLAFDQGAYRLFYKNLFGYKWNKLPPEFNWKTYWKENSSAKIIHFHGPKPHQKKELLSSNPPEHLKPLLPLLTENFVKSCDTWEDFHSEAVQ